MPKLKKQAQSFNNFLIHDKGKLVTVKPPTTTNLKILYHAIIATKQVINKAFGSLR